ncbi:MAG: TolC family protein [Azoarcus sp.]|nr:TolC family protein [Azoarcus sp.]
MSHARPARLVATLALATAALAAQAAEPPLTLDRAWLRAEETSPALKSAQANLAAVEGALTDARGLLWNNPQLSAEFGRRRVPQPGRETGREREWRAEISQTFEIAGQHGLRGEAARQNLSAYRENIEEVRRQLRAEVEQKFVRVLAQQTRLATETELVELIGSAAAAARKRFAAGEDARLDSNLAEVELGRAENQLEAAREQLIAARADLATTLQWPAETRLEVQGVFSPETETAIPYTLAQLLASADERPLLRALGHQARAARSRLGLERAAKMPDVTVGLYTGREGSGEARERVAGLSVSMPLPFFRGNAEGIGRAGAELDQTLIERQAAVRDTRANVTALWQRLSSQRDRVERLRRFVLQRLQDNQRLSTSAYRAGEIDLAQWLLATRQTLETRREILEAMTELALTRVALEQAAGWKRGWAAIP